MDEMAAKAFGVTSFTAVGHLLHINLKDHLLQHKKEIGEALLKNHPRALAVVNKISNIDNTYRNFDIEIIAKREGCTKTDDELMIAEVNENKCRFQFDFSKVYWNSRLSTEHERIIKKLNPSIDIVFDLFAGVGPFAVPAAKKKCMTYANDLNPDAVNWLKVNMRRNKVQDAMYETFNLDAKDFILNEFKSKLLEEHKHFEEQELATKPTVHILMNLPATAPTFLQNFIGLFRNSSIDCKKFDHVVYCYCFLKGLFDDPKSEVRALIEDNFGRELKEQQIREIFKVRNVAPYKDMYRVEILLDDEIFFGQASIMKKSSAKRVTVQIPSGSRKRSRPDSPVGEGDPAKRGKFVDYCNVI